MEKTGDPRDFKWPCKTCGAMQAPAFSHNQDLEVVSCKNCDVKSKGEHLDTIYCWCRPDVVYCDPDSGLETLRHFDLH